jgi:hypothetical protein
LLTEYNHLENITQEVRNSFSDGTVINTNTKIGEVGLVGQTTGYHLDLKVGQLEQRGGSVQWMPAETWLPIYELPTVISEPPTEPTTPGFEPAIMPTIPGFWPPDIPAREGPTDQGPNDGGPGPVGTGGEGGTGGTAGSGAMVLSATLAKILGTKTLRPLAAIH